MEGHYRDILKDVPQVAHLIGEYSCEQIWQAGIKVLGFPVTWMLSKKQVQQLESCLVTGDY